MRALVVYESMFGNTAAIADAIADGLFPFGEVELIEVGAATRRALPRDVRLVVIGGPTHAFGMSRRSTRRKAYAQSPAIVLQHQTGIRDWIRARGPYLTDVAVATFDTKVTKPRLPGSAARSAARVLRAYGADIVVPPMTFFVTGVGGPLVDGETVRARDWGDALAKEVPAFPD